MEVVHGFSLQQIFLFKKKKEVVLSSISLEIKSSLQLAFHKNIQILPFLLLIAVLACYPFHLFMIVFCSNCSL